MARLLWKKNKKKTHLPGPKHSCVYFVRVPTLTECWDEGVSTDLDIQNGKEILWHNKLFSCCGQG